MVDAVTQKQLTYGGFWSNCQFLWLKKKNETILLTDLKHQLVRERKLPILCNYILLSVLPTHFAPETFQMCS